MRPYWDEENTFGYLRFDLAEYRILRRIKPTLNIFRLGSMPNGYIFTEKFSISSMIPERKAMA